MNNIKQYLNLGKDYDTQFVDFLIESAKGIIEGYCNQTIFETDKTRHIDIVNGRGILPDSYVNSVDTVKLDGVEIEYSHIYRFPIHFIVAPISANVEVAYNAGMIEVSNDIILVAAEIVTDNYNKSRSKSLGVDGRTTSVGGENSVIKFVDLSERHKLMLARYRKVTI